MKIFLMLSAMGLSAERPAPAVYTEAQAESGRTAYLSSCGKCHTSKLTGRKGEAGELPELSSLPEGMRKVVQSYGGKVPPLVGSGFMDKWSTTKDLAARIKEAVGGFPPADLKDDTYLDLTAYVLQVSGAPAGAEALRPSTMAELRSLGLR